ncbi:MAG: hypothetical protein KDI88_13025, partial [Gammaproteobacteria bacterium]|nr:hypothetical protein [Gammaproteobacteria bacterium]
MIIKNDPSNAQRELRPTILRPTNPDHRLPHYPCQPGSDAAYCHLNNNKQKEIARWFFSIASLATS